MQNPGYGITKVGPATGKYNQAQGLQDYLNSMKMQTIADAGGVANMASGGIMNLKKSIMTKENPTLVKNMKYVKFDQIPPLKGPSSQGLIKEQKQDKPIQDKKYGRYR